MVIPAVWLALSSVIFSRISLFLKFAVNQICSKSRHSCSKSRHFRSLLRHFCSGKKWDVKAFSDVSAFQQTGYFVK